MIVLKTRSDLYGFFGDAFSLMKSILLGDLMPVLKLENDDEKREIEFELCYLKSLTTRERFLLMQKKTEEMKKMLRKRGYRKSSEIVKRS